MAQSGGRGFLSVVELRPPAQQQVDPGAEGGVRGQVDGGPPALHLRPHPAQQLFRRGGAKVKQLFSPQV